MDGQWAMAGGGGGGGGYTMMAGGGGGYTMQSGAVSGGGATYAMGGGGMMPAGGMVQTGGMMQAGGGQVVGVMPVSQMGACSPPVCGGYGGMAGGAMYGGGTTESNVFVEVTPEVQPNFNHGPNGTFVMEVPWVLVRLTTSCQPPPPLAPGLVPFKPYEEFMVQFPEVAQVVFDPNMQSPPGLGMTAVSTKRGAVIEVPQQVGLNAQLKANSPHGTLVLEDLQVTNGFKQKIGENMLHYKLKVDGQLSMNKSSGNAGAHRLEVELYFTFTCQFEAGQCIAPMAPPQMMQTCGGGGGAVMMQTPMVVQQQQQQQQPCGGMFMAGGPMQCSSGMVAGAAPMGTCGMQPMQMGGAAYGAQGQVMRQF